MYGAVASPGPSRRGSGQETSVRTPLLEEEESMGEVKIEVPPDPPAGPEYPLELGKTLLALLVLLLGFLITTFSLALTHERVPSRPPLPDIILDHTTYHAWGLAASEIVIIVSIVVAAATVLFHSHRTIVFRRVSLIAGLLYAYRGLTMFVTVLPMSDPNYVCAPKLNHTITFLEFMSRVVVIVTGGGMSFSDNKKYCGDFIFSGHTMILLLCFLVVREYTPRRLLWLHLACGAGLLFGVTVLLLSRGHYSIDVVIAYWVTSRVWWTYHTLAGSQDLRVRGEHNHMDNIWWWYLFRYFESRVPAAPLPREYSIPLPAAWTAALAAWVSRPHARLEEGEGED